MFRDHDRIEAQEWMWSSHGLGLKRGSIEADVYARIYQFSHHGSGVYVQSQYELAEQLEVNRKSITRAITGLLEKGLIADDGIANIKDEIVLKSKKTAVKMLRVVQVKIDEAIASFYHNVENGDKTAAHGTRDILSLGDEHTRDNMSLGDEGTRDILSQARDKMSLVEPDLPVKNSPYYKEFDNSLNLLSPQFITSSSINQSLTESDSLLRTGESEIKENNPPAMSGVELTPYAKQQSVIDDDETKNNFEAIVMSWPKTLNKSEEMSTFRSYKKALEEGYTHGAILDAAGSYIETYKSNNGTNLRFVKKLNNWLTAADGLHWELPKVKLEKMAYIKSGQCTKQHVEQKDEALEDMEWRLKKARAQWGALQVKKASAEAIDKARLEKESIELEITKYKEGLVAVA